MEEGKQPQIPPLGCGMTTKEQAEATATADSLRNDNKWHVRLYANCYFSLKDLLANASAQRKPKIERFLMVWLYELRRIADFLRELQQMTKSELEELHHREMV
jgi:hypothetical protein